MRIGAPSRHARFARIGLATTVVLVLGACGGAPDEEPPTAELPPGVLWIGDAETGDLSQFEDTPWNTVEAEAPTVVEDPAFVRDGRFAIRTAIPGAADIDEGTRSEVVPDLGNIRPGDDMWFAFSTLLGDGFPVDQQWQVIAQWKNEGEGSPPLSINVEDGRYLLAGGAGHPDDGVEAFEQGLGPAVPGQWVDWTVHITFSTERSTGTVEIWQNDTLVLPAFTPDSGTLYPSDDEDGPRSYVKLGYYRNSDIEPGGEVYFDNWRIGTSRDAVSAPSGA